MFGDNLRAFRQKAGYTQREFAKILGISASAVGMYEQGRREPDQKLLLHMAEVLGVSVDSLITGNGHRNDEIELNEMIELVINRMIAERNITLDGKKLAPSDVKNVVNAIRLGVSFAEKDIKNNKK